MYIIDTPEALKQRRTKAKLKSWSGNTDRFTVLVPSVAVSFEGCSFYRMAVVGVSPVARGMSQ